MLARSGGKWYSATIMRCRQIPAAIAYDIKYDDGESELGVKRAAIRAPGGSNKKNLEKGDKVEARHSGCGSKWYPGTITRCRDAPAGWADCVEGLPSSAKVEAETEASKVGAKADNGDGEAPMPTPRTSGHCQGLAGMRPNGEQE